MNPRMPRGARRVLSLLIAAVVVFAAASVAGDLRGLGNRLTGFGWWAFATAIGLALCNYAIRFVRWSLYLRRLEVAVPPASSVVVFLAGFALSITPGKVGELIKSYLLREIHGIPVTRTAPVVVAERMTDLVALLVLTAIGAAAYGVAVEVAALGGAVIGIGLLVLMSPRLCHAAVDLLTRPRPLRRFRARGHLLYDGIAELSRPVPLLWSTALAVVSWGCECVGFSLVLSAFPGTSVSLGLAILIYAATIIAGALSFLPGGLGVTEGTMTLLLVESARGGDRPTAVAGRASV